MTTLLTQIRQEAWVGAMLQRVVQCVERGRLYVRMNEYVAPGNEIYPNSEVLKKLEKEVRIRFSSQYRVVMDTDNTIRLYDHGGIQESLLPKNLLDTEVSDAVVSGLFLSPLIRELVRRGVHKFQGRTLGQLVTRCSSIPELR